MKSASGAWLHNLAHLAAMTGRSLFSIAETDTILQSCRHDCNLSIPSRRHVGVYSLLCQDHIVPNDIDIIDAFGGTFPDPALAEPAQDAKMLKARGKVAQVGCEMVCTDSGGSKKQKKKKKNKTTNKSKKGKKSKQSKKGKE